MADESEELTPEERQQLKDSLPDLVADTPRTTLAISRFRKLVSKTGAFSADALKKIVVEIGTEVVKKALSLG